MLEAKSSSSRAVSGKAGLIIDAEDFDNKRKLTQFYRLAGIKKENFRFIISGSVENIPEVNGAHILIPGEVSVKGEFRNQAVRDFSVENLDFIICHFSKNISASLLAAVSNAAVKIGNGPDDYGIYDVEINAGKIEDFQQEALKYLKILKQE